MGEVTGALLLKGDTKEVVKRHSSVIIPLLNCDSNSDDTDNNPDLKTNHSIVPQTAPCSSSRPPRRSAAIIGEKRTRNIFGLDA